MVLQLRKEEPMKKQILQIFLLFVIINLTVSGCDGPTTSSTQPPATQPPATQPPATQPPACPPIQTDAKATVTSDASSITILAGTTAYNDDSSGGYWCSTSQLTLVKVYVKGLVYNNGCFTDPNDKSYPCSEYNALAALNIEPSRVKFTAPPYPVLDYDISTPESQPWCTEKGWSCNGYAIYQLKDPVPPTPTPAWRYVSPADLIPNSTPPIVEGKNINHFSTFVLVELPAPQPFPQPVKAVMVVTSDFIPNGPGISNVFWVTFLIHDAPDLGMNEQTRLFRFSNQEMQLTVNGSYPTECLDDKILYPTVPEQLTCLFPIDMEVVLVAGVDGISDQVSIAPIAGGYDARLFATLEIY
jgi:hypothetical protein